MLDPAPVGAFRFAVLNDLHYTDATDRPWLEGIVRQVNATGAADGSPVELCLVLGDLGEMGTEEELAAARDILRGLHMPFHVVPGNHDGPPNRPMGGPDGLETFDRLFPNSRNYTFNHKGWQFIALDSTDASGWQHVRLQPAAWAFAKNAVKILDKSRPTVVFTHFPVGPGIPYALEDGAQLLQLLEPLNIPIVFSGHYHGLTEMIHNGVELVTNRCCSMRREIHDGQTSRGYFLCQARPDGTVAREFAEYRPS